MDCKLQNFDFPFTVHGIKISDSEKIIAEFPVDAGFSPKILKKSNLH